MAKTLPLLLIAALAGCVTVEPAPDPRGAVKPGQRLIVMVCQSPGPWIVADPDSKAESALKLMPLGSFLQNMQEEKINELSKEIQPYLPRPRYDQALEAELIKLLKAAHGGPVQTAAEAGIAPLQRREWNAAADQLDWRRKYYALEAGQKAPRDYSKLLSLDDALIVDVNLSFGLEPDIDDRTLPTLSAALRVYRADTTRLLWSREERLTDKLSSATLSEFRAVPSDLTDRLYALSVPFARQISSDLSRSLNLVAAPPPVAVLTAAPPPAYGAAAEVPLSTASYGAIAAPAASIAVSSPTFAVAAATAPAASPAPAPSPR